MNWLRHDLMYALRLLWRNPAFALITVLVFAVGIGTNVAIFTLINSVLLKPLAYANSDRLVVALHEGTLPVSPADYADYRREAKSFDQIGAAQAGGANLSGGARPEAVPALRMTAGVFTVLGVPPLLGRTFAPEEEHGASSSVVILSYDLWQTHFGGLRNVIGSKVRLDGVPFTVIGVMPQSFHFAPFWATHAQMWSPLDLDSRRGDRGGRSLRVFARLKPNVTLGQAQAEMDAIAARLAATYPATNKNLGIRVVPLREKVVGNVRPTLLVLMATVAFVLLIACANIANFVLTKVIERRREFALRKAIGASTSRLVRMLLTELFVLGTLGGTAGVLLAYSLVDLLPKLLPVGDLPRMQEVAVDGSALLFALAATTLSVLLAGLAPMLQISGNDVSESLKEGGRGGTESKARRRVRSLLVAAEVAISLVLLAGAGLMMRTMARLQSVDAGFDAHNVLSFQVSLGGTDFDRNGARVAVFRQILSRLATLPGVRSASAINHLPIGGDVWSLSYRVEGRPAPPPGEEPSAVYRVVMPGYFQTMKIVLLQGREFSDRDREGADRVAIINQALAQKQWPGRNPLGERVQFAAAFGAPQTFTIVGVARNAKQGEWVGTPKDEIYLSYLQRPDTFGLSSLAFVLCTDADPEKLVEPALNAVSSVDPNLAVSGVLSMERVVRDSLWRSRVAMLLLAAFAGIAALLAALGIYGAISYSVRRRTQEIGIRVALGASSWQVLRLAFGEGVRPVLAGVLAGFAGAIALSRLMTSLLYGVSATDPATFSAVLLVLSFICCAAISVPAVRAIRLDPVEALREE